MSTTQPPRLPPRGSPPEVWQAYYDELRNYTDDHGRPPPSRSERERWWQVYCAILTGQAASRSIDPDAAAAWAQRAVNTAREGDML